MSNERDLSHVFANNDNGFINLGLGNVVSDDFIESFNSLVDNFDIRLEMQMLSI